MRLLNEKEFTEMFAEKLCEKNEGLKISFLRHLEVETEFNGSSGTRHFLDNAYLEYQSNSNDLDEILTRYLKVSDSLYNYKTDFVNVNDILPVIKDLRFIEHLKEVQPDFEDNLLFEKYNDELFIFYVEDTETNINYLNREDFLSLQMNFSDLKLKSIENLENSVKIEKHGENGYYMIVADGNYESSLILMDIWSNENFALEGEFVIGIPARDVLIVTGSNDIENLKVLKEVVENINETGDHLVSDKIFIFKNNKFEFFK